MYDFLLFRHSLQTLISIVHFWNIRILLFIVYYLLSVLKIIQFQFVENFTHLSHQTIITHIFFFALFCCIELKDLAPRGQKIVKPILENFIRLIGVDYACNFVCCFKWNNKSQTHFFEWNMRFSFSDYYVTCHFMLCYKLCLGKLL
jgi:hypothetical protein